MFTAKRQQSYITAADCRWGRKKKNRMLNFCEKKLQGQETIAFKRLQRANGLFKKEPSYKDSENLNKRPESSEGTTLQSKSTLSIRTHVSKIRPRAVRGGHVTPGE